jgi:hypothetical protein
MGSYVAKISASKIRDNVKASRVGTHPKKPVFLSQSGFDAVFIS